MKKILITGANGFIGKSLSELLDKTKYEIVTKSRQDLFLLDTFVVNKFFQSNDFDFVINAASVGGRRFNNDNPHTFYENVQMYENLIACKKSFGQMITFGSGAEFGDCPYMATKSDLNELLVMTYYGLAKRHITNLVKKNNEPVHILRIFGCFGPNESPESFFKANMVRRKKGEPIIVHQNRWIDFVSIYHVVKVIDKLMTETGCVYEGDYNVVPNAKLTLSQWAEKINGIDNNTVDIILQEGLSSPSYSGFETNKVFVYNEIDFDEDIRRMYNEL